MTGVPVQNVLRFDRYPNLSFKYYGNRLIAHDFVDSEYCGDIFHIAGKILRLNCNNGKHFSLICTDIIKVCLQSGKQSLRTKYRNFNNTECTIDYQNCTKTNFDYRYFEEYGITRQLCDKYIDTVYTYSIDSIRIKYRYSKNDRCYAYRVNPANKIKLYFPDRNKGHELPRFITNNSCIIENLDEIYHSKLAIACKSQKDRLLMMRLLKDLRRNDVQLITFSSEVQIIPKNLISILNDYISNLYIMFDNDSAGIAAMQSLKQRYAYEYLVFSQIETAKDPTDYCKQFKYRATYQNLKKLMENI
jgi:hypothetical protein